MALLLVSLVVAGPLGPKEEVLEPDRRVDGVANEAEFTLLRHDLDSLLVQLHTTTSVRCGDYWVEFVLSGALTSSRDDGTEWVRVWTKEGVVICEDCSTPASGMRRMIARVSACPGVTPPPSPQQPHALVSDATASP